MRYLLYVITNIQKLIKHKPLLFTFLIISQIVCIVVVVMICGLVDNANRVEEEVTEEEKTFNVVLGQFDYGYNFDWVDENGEAYSDEIYYVRDAKPKFNELIEFLGSDFDYIWCLGSLEDGPSLSFSTGIYSPGYEYDSDEYKSFCNSKEKIVRLDPHLYEEDFGKLLEVGDKIDINGIEYTVSSAQENLICIDIPYAALQDDKFIVKSIFIGLKDVCTAERNEEINNKIEELFNNKEIFPPEVRDLQEQQNRNLVYIITAAVILMVLLNISRVYSYILSYRKKTFAVMSICGASKFKIFLIYFVELMLTLIATYWIGVFIFDAFILQPLGNMYPTFLSFMTPGVYRTVFEIYIIVAVIIMSITISVFISRSSVDMERSGK